MKYFRNAAIAAVGLSMLAMTGCSSLGPKSIRRDQYPYNDAIHQSWDEQMLLNLVRLRYRENPYFLNVSSVTSSYTLNLGLSGKASVATEALKHNQNSFGIEPSVGYENSPTISYTPLAGKEFVKSLTKPVGTETIIAMTQNGWSIERVFNVCVEQLNSVRNAPSASGPTPMMAPDVTKFHYVSKTLRELQKEGLIFLGEDPAHDPLKLENMLEPDDKDQYLYILPEAFARTDVKNIYNMLGLSDTNRLIKFTSNFLKVDKDSQLKMRTRTVLGIMFYLSQAVEVPQAHIEEGLVTITETADCEVLNWACIIGDEFFIRSSKSKPKCADTKVFYRGYWYYIDNADLNARSTFLMLNEVFNRKAGAGDGGPTRPQLTIPVGGISK